MPNDLSKSMRHCASACGVGTRADTLIDVMSSCRSPAPNRRTSSTMAATVPCRVRCR